MSNKFDLHKGGGGGPTPFLYMATRFLANVIIIIIKNTADTANESLKILSNI